MHNLKICPFEFQSTQVSRPLVTSLAVVHIRNSICAYLISTHKVLLIRTDIVFRGMMPCGDEVSSAHLIAQTEVFF